MDNTKTQKNVAQAKKIYKTPQVMVYGSIEKLTQTVGGTGATDGGGAKSANKTRL